MTPFVKTSVIEHLQFVCDDERYDIISEALLKHNEPSHTSITVLKRMYPLKAHMKIKDVFKCPLPDGIVFRKKSLYLLVNLFWRAGIHSSNFIADIGKFLPEYLAVKAKWATFAALL